MNHPPSLETDRLLLRPFVMSDASRVQSLAGDVKVYESTLNIPHPYQDGVAEKWIASHLSQFYNSEGVTLAITLKSDGSLIGAIGLVAVTAHQSAELGYWIGVPYWNNGYCTEAAIVTIRYGYSILKYHKIIAKHLECNAASGRVMEKAGMRKEGVLVDEVNKDGTFHTLIVYGIINSSANHC